MVKIELQNVGVDFVLYETSARSLKKTAFRTAVGGFIANKDDGSKTTIRALQDISFTLNEGDRLALIGPNGAGKTTLLRVLAGIYYPTSGSVSIQGQCVPLFDISLGLDDEATGYENIMLRGLVMGLDRKEIEKRVEEISEFSGLGEFLHLPVRTYSSGMTLRLLFSIATSVNSDILLMDEWIAMGDADFIERANQRLHGVVSRSKILAFASHNPDYLRAVCNRAVLLEGGRIVAEGSVDDVLKHYQSDRQVDAAQAAVQGASEQSEPPPAAQSASAPQQELPQPPESKYSEARRPDPVV
jgi:ABC-type polysaccharide/polyol phosphate transport system ATPase subunit